MIKDSELKVIEELEKKIGLTLVQVPVEKIGVSLEDWCLFGVERGFVVNGNGDVVGLNLHNSEITDLSILSGLAQLTSLNLRNTGLTDVSVLSGLNRLKTLDLKNNNIKTLPESIVDLGMEINTGRYEYRGVLLHGNPMESPPWEVLEKGQDAINAYYQALKEGQSRPLNEVRILLVGESYSGKTSLLKQLLNQEFNKNESQTHGINIETLYLLIGESATAVKGHVWDFGGQEIMHATHQFFLSRRSLYILVLDCRKEEDKSEYWLKHIRGFGGNSPVLVALNKIDENPGFDVNRRNLKEKYPNIIGFFPISCADGTGIDTLKEALSTALESVEIIGTTWGGEWFKVKTQLEKMTEDFISFEQYRSICASHGIRSEVAVKTLLDLLNDLGVILNFTAFHLEGTHILEPRWVTEGVYRIINAPALAAGKGILALDQLGDILKQHNSETDFYYPRDKYVYIIGLMKEFELCYELDSGHVLVPDLLAVQQMEFEFDYNDALSFMVDYDFLPRALLTRFMVRMHAEIRERQRWRTGVVLKSRSYEAVAVVKADHEDRRITVHLAGEGKRDYFAVIRHTLRDLENTYKQLNCTEKIPLPDHPGITVEYNELIGHELAGKRTIFIGKLRKEYNVSQLLNGIVKQEELQKDLLAESRRELGGVGSASPAQNTPKPESEPTGGGNSVFVSYCHRDRAYLDRLKVHLKPLVREGEIHLWDDSRLKAGDRWQSEIGTALKSACAAILLVSPDFFASDFITTKELPPLLSKAEGEGTRIIPLIVNHCGFTGDRDLNVFQAFNNPAEPLSSLADDKREAIYARLAGEIKDLLNQ